MEPTATRNRSPQPVDATEVGATEVGSMTSSLVAEKEEPEEEEEA